MAGLTGLAFALRLACLDQSLYADELFLYEIVHDQSLGEVFSTVHDTEKTPPLGFLLSWLSDKAGSAPELLRLPSFAASVATVPLVYLVALRTIGRNAGLVAAAWLALSPFQIFYGTETRSYALVTALVVLSTVALMAALDSRRKRWWALYVLAITAAVYSHYTAVLVLAPQAAWALWAQRDCWREQLCGDRSGGRCSSFPGCPRSSSRPRTAPTRRDVSPLRCRSRSRTWPSLSPERWSAIRSSRSRTFRDGEFCWRLAAVVSGAVLVAIYRVATGRARLRPSLRSRGTLLLLLAVGPFLLLLAYSLRPETSFLLARNLSVSVPYAVLLVGWLLTFPGGRLRITSAHHRARAGVGRHSEDAHSGLPATGCQGRRRVHRRRGATRCPGRRRVHLQRPTGSGHSPLSGATTPCLLRGLELRFGRAPHAATDLYSSRFRGYPPSSACSSPHRSTPRATASPMSIALRGSLRS